MTIPILEIKTGASTQLLYGSGARFVATADSIVTMRSIDNNEVTLRAPRRGSSRTLKGGDTLSTTLTAGEIIEIV